MSLTDKLIRAAVGVLALFVILALVLNWLGDYRSASHKGSGGSTETSASAEATGAGGDSGMQGEGGAGSTSPSVTKPTGKTVTVLVDGLNFRAAPERGAELIRGLNANEQLEYLGEENGWFKVRDSKGTIGYVSSSSQYTRIGN